MEGMIRVQLNNRRIGMVRHVLENEYGPPITRHEDVETRRNPMTEEYRKIANPSSTVPDDKDISEAIDEALEEAARRGIIEDTGKRKWSERNGRNEIVWRSKICSYQ
jgi:hypothetical protein